MTANGINFVDENNARALLLGLFKHVTDPGRTHAHKHFHKVRTGNREERYLCFTGDRLCQQRLTGTRRPDHQNALRGAATQSLEFAWITQEVYQLFNVFLGLINTGHVTKGRLDLIFTQKPGLALAERHRAFASTAALHLTHEEHKQCDNDQNRERSHQSLSPQPLPVWLFAYHLNVIG